MAEKKKAAGKAGEEKPKAGEKHKAEAGKKAKEEKPKKSTAKAAKKAEAKVKPEAGKKEEKAGEEKPREKSEEHKEKGDKAGHKDESREKAGKESEEAEKAGKERHGRREKHAKGFNVVPDWVEYNGKQVEEIIVQLANAAHTSSEIGAILRDQYGIPNAKAVVGKNILAVMAENKLEGNIPSDLLSLIRKSVVLQKHMKEHRHDQSAKRGYDLTVSKIRKLVNYYHRKKKLPEGWRYTPEEAELLVK